MHQFDSDHYLNTPEALLTQSRRRSRRRIRFSIDDVEPRAKHSMSESDKDEVQRQLLDRLVGLHRRAFRGPLALRLRLCTTDKAPTQSHNVAKNLLDLFGRARPNLATKRRSLLYADDHQVHALAVTCRHGEAAPLISAVASPLGSLLVDLDLGMRSRRERDNDRPRWEYSGDLGEAVDEVKAVLRDEAEYRRGLGDQAFESLLRYVRQRAQECLLVGSVLRPSDLAMMYNVAGYDIDLANWWEQTFASSPFRIRLTELPEVKGASALWKHEIDEKLRAFQAQFGWLIDPLLVPVALEVVIKPPPTSRQNGLHDLDNVLRTYLIPRVVDILKPVSHYSFTLDNEAIRRDAPESLTRGSGRPSRRKPPASTKSGVTRYEAWRLPPAREGSDGFVSVAIVTDMMGNGDVLGQIDEEIEEWRKLLEDSL
jgi:hypothetical protein